MENKNNHNFKIFRSLQKYADFYKIHVTTAKKRFETGKIIKIYNDFDEKIGYVDIADGIKALAEKLN